MKSHLCKVVKNDYTQVYSVNYGDPQVSWPQQDVGQHKEKVTATHGEKDIFKNWNEEALKQGILGTWNL